MAQYKTWFTQREIEQYTVLKRKLTWHRALAHNWALFHINIVVRIPTQGVIFNSCMLMQLVSVLHLIIWIRMKHCKRSTKKKKTVQFIHFHGIPSNMWLVCKIWNMFQKLLNQSLLETRNQMQAMGLKPEISYMC